MSHWIDAWIYVVDLIESVMMVVTIVPKFRVVSVDKQEEWVAFAPRALSTDGHSSG